MERLQAGTLEERRAGLLAWISASSLSKRSNGRVTIVFDGKQEHFGGAVSGVISVVFSKGESADDLIKRVIEQAHNQKKWVVVSDDKEIKLYVRALGAGVLSVNAFAAELNKGSISARGSNKAQSSKYISHTQEQAINKEFEKIWKIK